MFPWKRRPSVSVFAPTSSSTAALAMGDALAIALIDKRQFREKDFYKFHLVGVLE